MKFVCKRFIKKNGTYCTLNQVHMMHFIYMSITRISYLVKVNRESIFAAILLGPPKPGVHFVKTYDVIRFDVLYCHSSNKTLPAGFYP